MLKVSSSTFYFRHHNEISKYTKGLKKVLYVTYNTPTKSFNNDSGVEVLKLNIELDINSQLKNLKVLSQLLLYFGV